MPAALEEAEALVRLGLLEEAQWKLRKFLKASPGYAYGWYLLGLSLGETGEAAACLEEAHRIWQGSSQDRAEKFLRWLGKSAEYDYQEFFFEVPRRISRLDDAGSGAWYEQVRDITEGWWRQDQEFLLDNLRGLEACGWEILSEQGPASYKIVRESRTALEEYRESRKSNARPSMLWLFGLTRRNTTSLVAVALVIVLATGGLGFLLLPLALAAMLLYAPVRPVTLISSRGYRALARKRRVAA